jgi:hypothetical protein
MIELAKTPSHELPSGRHSRMIMRRLFLRGSAGPPRRTTLRMTAARGRQRISESRVAGTIRRRTTAV